MRLTSPIPTDTREALKLHNWQIDNIALLLNKYLDFFLEKENKKELLEIAFPKNLAFSLVVKDDDVFKVAMNKLVEIKHSGYKTKNIEGVFFNKILECNHRKLKQNSRGYKEFEKIKFSIKLLGKQIFNYTGGKDENKNKTNCQHINKFLKLKNSFETYRNKLIKNDINTKIKEILDKIIERQQLIADESVELKTQSRLVVGLGSGSILETSIKLHHIYGVPYIPASAIKGVLRAYRIWKLANWENYKYLILESLIDNYEENKFEKTKNTVVKNLERIRKSLENLEEEIPEENIRSYLNSTNEDNIKPIIEIFGNQQQKGKLIILDAYPTNFKGFDIEIMNPHFPDYYDGDKPPADWQNPNPITFLAIPKETTFKFFFKNINTYFSDEEENPLKQLKKDLQNAFENIGIGGKTALGYGILS